MFVIASLKEAWRSVLEFYSFEHYKYKSKRNDWQEDKNFFIFFAKCHYLSRKVYIFENMEIIAHIRSKNDNSVEKQPLSGPDGHLEGVAALAESFANAFNAGEFAKCAGLLHDLGKFKTDFQNYIRQSSGYDTEESDVFGVGKVDHSAAGAIWANKNIPQFGLLLSYIIAGHHGGIPNYYGKLDNRLAKEENLTESFENGGKEFLSDIKIPALKAAPVKNPRDLHLWVRMLFSCLVDADFLDTERFMSPENFALRENSLSLKELKARFDSFMDKMSKNAPSTEINKIRAEILSNCRQGAMKEPGLFSLTVPTGGGKTLASMGFALDHAIKYGKSRIIVAIPYTSIIEQTADVYKNVFKNGDEDLSNVVLEHHSNLDPDKETTKSKLAVENWDAPIVVTTNVQLLESLFAAKTSRCRKIHNIANSVIILDEAQMLPPEYLKPILGTLESLTTDFGCSVVLCTATQPTLQGHIGSAPAPHGEGGFEGLPPNNVRELMKNPQELFEKMNRTNVTYIPEKIDSWEKVAEQLIQYDQVLCIVNTRKDCKALYDSMPPDTIHLSASMCGQHRSNLIAEIKRKLKNGEPIRVVSTQLVEAGVDIDFPVVYRAMAGLDSVAQAAGRCNREGKLKQGNVYIFNAPKEPPVGLLRFGAQASQHIIDEDKLENIPLIPEIFSTYFKTYYNQVHSFDKKDILHDLDLRNNLKAEFRTAAENFQLINDKAQKSVIVWYSDDKINSQVLIAQLETSGLKRDIMRKLQRCTVNIPKNNWAELQKEGYIIEIKGPDGIGLDIWQQGTSSLYSEKTGFSLDGPKFEGTEFIC
ncbi:CRISPR-associated helicase Cas3' [uncultured Fibrobacter sp.]|uniref:CRISPR-associated helicase Cas3' n=1 Tax=uncultured Fibrobacter sp. TaxID=261512 RepID=UPI0025F4DA70|nr:CRISPR-associated helicase Cas3' [uncultured Fibrobacter sp.]